MEIPAKARLAIEPLATAMYVALLWGAAPCLPAADYRLTHCDLRIRPDFATSTVHEQATINIDNPRRGQRFTFLLGRGYSVQSVTANGVPAEASRNDDSIEVHTPTPVERVVLAFDITGKPGRSGDEDRDVVAPDSLFLLWSDRFYPADFEQWTTLTTTVVLPPRFQAIAPGRLISTAQDGDSVEYRFAARKPVVAFSVFADRRWTRTQRDIGGIHVETLLDQQSQQYAERIFRTSADVLAFFAGLHGGYPFEQFAFVTLDGMYARRAFAGFIGYSPEYLEKEMVRTGYDAHETSLLWWFGATRGHGPGAWQWTEGLGDYVEVMYGEARRLPLPENFVNFRKQYLDLPPDKDLPICRLSGRAPQAIVHGRLPWTMGVLREAIGDAAFRSALHTLFAQYQRRTFTLDEFVAAFEAASGRSLGWWREQWLDRPGVPTLNLSASALQDGKGYRVECVIDQVGEARVVPLTIGIRTQDGLQLHRMDLKEARTAMSFVSAAKPIEVVLDPEQRIIFKTTAPVSFVLREP
jgi:hypothetical protein